MARKRFRTAVLSGIALLVWLTSAAGKPNVLFILTDDQRGDTIGALGNAHIHTPNLDRLVRRAFVFRNAYCLGGEQRRRVHSRPQHGDERSHVFPLRSQ
jgi:phosphoglycerol transferase MdoB-like AlkP superfamily enzyme